MKSNLEKFYCCFRVAAAKGIASFQKLQTPPYASLMGKKPLSGGALGKSPMQESVGDCEDFNGAFPYAIWRSLMALVRFWSGFAGLLSSPLAFSKHLIWLYRSLERIIKCHPAGAHLMSNGLNPDLLSARERLAELSEILAAGLIRLRSRQSSELSRDLGECSLHIPAHRRDVTVTCLETAG